MSQHFFDLIRKGKTAEIAEAVEAQPILARSRDAQGISALLLAVYTQQPMIRDFLCQAVLSRKSIASTTPARADPSPPATRD